MSLDTLIQKRGRVKASVTRLLNSALSADAAAFLEEEVEAKLDLLEKNFGEFNDLQDKIDLKATDEVRGQMENEEAEFEEKYTATWAALRVLIRPSRRTSNPNRESEAQNLDSNPTAQIKLPRLDLPTFSGSYQEWSSFYDLFLAIVHNNKTLSGAQKLHYLKSSLKDEAAQLLRSVQITDANYAEAWTILTARYQNKKHIINSHLKSLLSQAPLQSESASGLRRLLDYSVENVRALKVLGQETDHWDSFLVYILSEKLDSDSRRQWELSTPTDQISSFDDLKGFLEKRCRALEAVSINPVTTPFNPHHKQTHGKEGAKNTTATLHASSSSVTCVICHLEHEVYRCPKFKAADISTRTSMVKSNSLCFNCLRTGHSSKQCKSSSCRECSKKHHTLLHNDRPPPANDNQKPNSTNTHLGISDSKSQVLLSTARVLLEDSTCEQQTGRVLIDQGSESHFISECCVQRLGLPRKRANISINGIAMASAGTVKGMVDIKLTSTTKEHTILIEALIVPRITGRLPSGHVDSKTWPHLQHLQLADPFYYQPGEIDVLLGAELFADIILDGKILGPKGSPAAINTVYGYVLTGRVTAEITKSITSLHTALESDDTLRKFWEIEEINVSTPLTTEEKDCESHFKSTHTREPSGRFAVKFPFRNGSPQYGNSRDGAIQRLKQMERRLSKNPYNQQQYCEFMREYEELGHMKLLNSDDLPKFDPYYIPHHFVLKEESTTTKFRVVFDASKKTTNGLSLNDNLMVGPRLQEDLVPLLLRFRLHKVAFTADIAKMYRQIRMDPTENDYQRIVWRESPNETIKEYQLLTVTYGTASAPYLATKCLQQLAYDEMENFPEAGRMALEDFFMDDLMSGTKDTASAIQIQTDLIELLKRGGFNLRKWSSNDPAVLEALPPALRETQVPLSIELDQTVKTLGLHWHPAPDYFSFTVNLPQIPTKLTKRGLLSDVARIFDPLGWLAPSVVIAKTMFQKLWTLGLSWDEILPQSVSEEWMNFRSQLFSLQQIRVDRWISSDDEEVMELHGFSDASEVAYSAVLFSRSVNKDGKFKVRLLQAKTKVAPVKQISIPRLELCGAVLLAKLVDKSRKALRLEISKVTVWTDSTIVLCWLKGHPNRWKTFVANRVTEIQDLVPPEHWHHVRSEDNPADCASRGVFPSDLISHPLWWTGPKWLSENSNKWILTPDTDMDLSSVGEQRKETSSHVIIIPEMYILNRYSSLTRLKRITAYCLRFANNCLIPADQRTIGFLTTSEIRKAMNSIIKTVQMEEFQSEIASCVAGDDLHPKSRLLTLNPFLDQDGLLRVGGRLKHAKINQDQKFPIILPRKHKLTELVVDNEHIRHLHAGPQLLLSVLQRQFWILCGRDVIRRRIHKCIVCFRLRATTAQQMMGDLPISRTEPTRAFLRTGVDYAGPLTLRVAAGRARKTTKGYIAIFVCLVTKAIHLELVSDLTSEAFIAALRRFISRRGRCTDLYSDCGTNFVGAKRELEDLCKLSRSSIHNEKITKELSNDGISWHLNPPSAPHFGGLWEAGVKSMKSHLYRVVGNALLTFEEMYTVLTQIEGCLNSRPLCPLSNDPNDLAALTPGHFLIGDAVTAIPEPNLTHLNTNRLSRWQRMQQLTQNFWKRWNAEYLSRLQQRPKWMKKYPDLVEGTMVLIKDDRLSPLQWNLARVTQVHPGKDGIVRVVSVQCQNGVLKRPIVKLCPLPLDDC